MKYRPYNKKQNRESTQLFTKVSHKRGHINSINHQEEINNLIPTLPYHVPNHRMLITSINKQ